MHRDPALELCRRIVRDLKEKIENDEPISGADAVDLLVDYYGAAKDAALHHSHRAFKRNELKESRRKV